jgi:hypothetical protein
LLDSVGLEQVLVVEMVEQDVEALLGICDVLLVLCWCPCLDSLQVCIEDLVNGTRCIRNMRSVTRSCCVLVPINTYDVLYITYDTLPLLAQPVATDLCQVENPALVVRLEGRLEEVLPAEALAVAPLVAVLPQPVAFVELATVHRETQRG